jgi:protein-disulfide isomerase
MPAIKRYVNFCAHAVAVWELAVEDDTMTYLGEAARRTASAVLAAVMLAAAVLLLAVPDVAQSANPQTQWDYPLLGDDGQRVSNHSVKLPGPIDRLPGVIVTGNPSGKASLAEFYDLNCPYCRQAATDIGGLISHDRELRLLLVPYPVLGVASITASRVELAVGRLGTPAQFYAFHRKMFARRGTNDGARALEVAQSLGLDKGRLLVLADSDQITETMKALVRLGTALGLQATPSFVVGDVAILGYPGPHALAAILTAATRCGKVVC